MPFAALYEAVQHQSGPIRTSWLKDKAISLSHITKVKEQWTGTINPEIIRGFYIEGPLGPPVPLQENEALIVLARSLDASERRFVYRKELMHIFDEPSEKADTKDKFDLQVEGLADPSVETSPQYRAELKALFRAISLSCPEHKRLEFKKSLDSGKMSLQVVSAALRISPAHARHLFRADYLEILAHVK